MKFSRWDILLVMISGVQISSLLWWAINFSHLSIISNALLFIFELLLFYYNPIVVTHNFLHTAFFKSSLLNSFFSGMNSMNLGLPQILYKFHHLNHHRYNNSLEDPSSTYRYGKGQKQEHWFKYSSLSLFREGTQMAIKEAIDKKKMTTLLIETLLVLLFWATLLLINGNFFFKMYLPLFFCGWFLAHLENYFEHFKAKSPSNRFGNAVSYYGKFYNKIMFNEGLHQEHHISPQEHWTKRMDSKNRYQEQMRSAGAHEASLPPLLGMFEK